MQDSHTQAPTDDTHDDPAGLRLISAATAGLPEGLAERVDGHLATFAAHMTQGLLAASTAVGLEVMTELMAAEVDEIAARRAVTMRPAAPPGTAPSRAR